MLGDDQVFPKQVLEYSTQPNQISYANALAAYQTRSAPLKRGVGHEVFQDVKMFRVAGVEVDHTSHAKNSKMDKVSIHLGSIRWR